MILIMIWCPRFPCVCLFNLLPRINRKAPPGLAESQFFLATRTCDPWMHKVLYVTKSSNIKYHFNEQHSIAQKRESLVFWFWFLLDHSYESLVPSLVIIQPVLHLINTSLTAVINDSWRTCRTSHTSDTNKIHPVNWREDVTGHRIWPRGQCMCHKNSGMLYQLALNFPKKRESWDRDWSVRAFGRLRDLCRCVYESLRKWLKLQNT